MADPHNQHNTRRVVDALADLFDAVPPSNRSEAEDELRNSGSRPDAVGQRIARLAMDSLEPSRSLRAASVSATPPRRDAWVTRPRLLSAAAAVALCVFGWVMLRQADRTVSPPRGASTSSTETYRRARELGAQPDAGQDQARAKPREQPPKMEERAAASEPAPWSVEHAPAPAAVPASQLAMDVGNPTGSVVTADSLADHEALMSPGVQWAVRHGMQMRSVETRPIRPPAAYREATERYQGTVRLAPDGMSLENYVAGLPFPRLDPNDPQVALKIMWNYEHRFMATDDFEADGFIVETGTPGSGSDGMSVERRMTLTDFQRVYRSGRLYRDPRPTFPDKDDARFREFLPRFVEPGDLAGITGVSVRHNNANTPDDTWIYTPSLRRVRRYSTAVRSDAMFDQDADIDSFFGFNGSVATMDWKFLGERKVLACMHAQNDPVRWGQGSADFAFDDDWEIRTVYVVEGTPRDKYYMYSKRVLYIDKEAWVVPYADMYDIHGELWKTWINMYSVRAQTSGGASLPGDTVLFAPAAVVIDMLRPHVTRISFPGTVGESRSGWFVNQGLSGENIKISTTIQAGH